MTARVEAHGLYRDFGPTRAVDGVGLVVESGQVHALVGLNGAGKSTLMRLILGMIRPDHGTISINGFPLAGLPTEMWSRVGHVIEAPFAYPELTVRTNLMMAARLHLVDPSSIPAMVDQVVRELELDAYTRIQSRRLSQGNRQRLGLAAALQHHPDLIVLDEPSNALDPAGVILLREAILRRRDNGAGILVSSHHLDEVARIADLITVMNHGRLIGTLDPHTADLEHAFFTAVHADDQAHR
jgi:ABC-2 type transport system ATP-binding protein